MGGLDIIMGIHFLSLQLTRGLCIAPGLGSTGLITLGIA